MKKIQNKICQVSKKMLENLIFCITDRSGRAENSGCRAILGG
jgi:hypothetical protein